MDFKAFMKQWVIFFFLFGAAKNRAAEAQYSGMAHMKSHTVFGTAGKKETENIHPR